MNENQEKSIHEKNKKTIKTIQIISTFILIAITLFIIFLNNIFAPLKKPQIYDKSVRPEYMELQKLHEKEEKTLSTYRLINPEKGICGIPIDNAIKLTEDEYTKKQMQHNK